MRGCDEFDGVDGWGGRAGVSRCMICMTFEKMILTMAP